VESNARIRDSVDKDEAVGTRGGVDAAVNLGERTCLWLTGCWRICEKRFCNRALRRSESADVPGSLAGDAVAETRAEVLGDA